VRAQDSDEKIKDLDRRRPLRAACSRGGIRVHNKSKSGDTGNETLKAAANSGRESKSEDIA